MYICLYAYMFVIMWMCFSCRYTAYLYHFASTWRDMRAFVMTLTDNHVWTRHFYPHDCRSLHHEHIFDALICCAMCIDSLLDLIWFDLICMVLVWLMRFMGVIPWSIMYTVLSRVFPVSPQERTALMVDVTKLKDDVKNWEAAALSWAMMIPIGVCSNN